MRRAAEVEQPGLDGHGAVSPLFDDRAVLAEDFHFESAVNERRLERRRSLADHDLRHSKAGPAGEFGFDVIGKAHEVGDPAQDIEVAVGDVNSNRNCAGQHRAICRQAFEQGEDIHDRTAREMFGEVTRDTRGRAKTINFAILYGISRWGLAGRLKVEPDEAQAMIDTYFQRFPGIQKYIVGTLEQVRECGYSEISDCNCISTLKIDYVVFTFLEDSFLQWLIRLFVYIDRCF